MRISVVVDPHTSRIPVRNHQGRSRERRKQRVIELEQRVCQLEEAELLQSLGFDRACFEWYLQGATGVGGLELQNSGDSYSVVTPATVLSSVMQFEATIEHRPEIVGSAEVSQTVIQNHDVSGPNAERENLSSILDNLGRDTLIPTGLLNGKTTLCSIAFHLVIQTSYDTDTGCRTLSEGY
ncbi:hypothetical protein BDW72DRAFT_212653 [Aspergillus terricola var. indicus]